MIHPQSSALLTLIFGDEPNPEQKGIAGLCVRDADSYLRARLRIADYLRNSDSMASPLQIYVQGERYRAWFADLKGIGEPLVAVREESIRRRLEEVWCTTLPAALLPEELLALDLEVLPSPQGNVTDHILEHKLGNSWVANAPGPEHAAQLLSDDLLRSDDVSFDADRFPWLSSQCQQRANEWETAASKKWRPFYQSYINDAQSTEELLALDLEVLPSPQGNVTDHILEHKLGSVVQQHFRKTRCPSRERSTFLSHGIHDSSSIICVAYLDFWRRAES